LSRLAAYAPGIYARSEALVQATRDFDRGRATADDVRSQVDEDLLAFVEAQRAAGLDLLADGMLTWQDPFRPFVEKADGLESGALTRFLDTNTFFRAPRGNGGFRLAAPLGDEFVSEVPGARLVTLPSPFAFATAGGLDPRDVASELLAPALAALDPDLVVLSEPFLAREPDPDLDALGEAIASLDGSVPLVLQLTFGDAGPLLERLVDLPVSGVGVDFYASSIDAVPEGFAKLLLAGVVDTRSSSVEDPEVVAGFVRRLRERTAGDVAIAPNGDLQFVAEPIARRKVAALGAAKELVT
jgi:5-methyltetrahydropteroyltriglutamate--homocysteine methyltransferase